MACSFEEMGGYAVTPMLVSSFNPEKCCEGPPLCYPCLPRCPKGQIIYCCEKPLQKCLPTSEGNEDCCNEKPKRTTPPQPAPCKQQTSCPRYDQYCSPCHSPCKQVKTKYVIPCYRYEDGRIVNQPTILMRRACEVAVGARPRRKPFITTSYTANAEEEVHRYISQDERGNCCYHFEKKKHNEPECCHTCNSCPQCHGECVRAKMLKSPKDCYYYCC